MDVHKGPWELDSPRSFDPRRGVFPPSGHSSSQSNPTTLPQRIGWGPIRQLSCLSWL